MCIYNACKLLLTKGKLDRKQNIKTKGGKSKWISPTHGSERSCASSVVCKALKALLYLSCF